jgi:hypothetical protein
MGRSHAVIERGDETGPLSDAPATWQAAAAPRVEPPDLAGAPRAPAHVAPPPRVRVTEVEAAPDPVAEATRRALDRTPASGAVPHPYALEPAPDPQTAPPLPHALASPTPARAPLGSLEPPVALAAPVPPPAPAASPAAPNVIIEQISVITQASPGPVTDPFASLAGRRRAESRHHGEVR